MRVGVILGGPSREREVSLRSGENVYQALLRLGYDAIKIEFDKDIIKNICESKIDVAYIILHGRPGEDGSIQGILDFLNIPYTGSGVLASALALNKVMAKKIFLSVGINTAKFVEIYYSDDINEKIKIIKKTLMMPLMIKPIAEGSSIGVEKIFDISKLEEKILLKLQEFKNIFVEEYINGKELTVGIIGSNKSLKALPILELVPKKEFYDYEAKYTKGLTEFIIPANLSKEMTEKVKQTAIKAHNSLGCFAVSRIDMIVKDTDIFVLEVNTIPGMTQTSDLPIQAKAEGISFDELVDTILKLAFVRT